MNRALRLLAFLLAFVEAPNAHAETSELSDPDSWAEGTNQRGSGGVFRVDTARPLRTRSLVLVVGAEFSNASSIVVSGDADIFNREFLHALYIPIDNLEVGFGVSFITNTYTTFTRHTLNSLGNPQVDVKYTYRLSPSSGVGLLASARMVTDTTSLVGSSVERISGIVSSHFGRWLTVAANVGYVYDGTTDDASSTPDERYALGLSKHSQQLSYGIAVLGNMKPAAAFSIGPFVEFSGAIVEQQPIGASPARLSAGIKGLFFDTQWLDVTLGADARIAGKPSAINGEMGLPPWSVGAQVSARFLGGSLGCANNSECVGRETCRDHVCVLVETIETETVKEVEVTRLAETFFVAGFVVSATTQAPIADTVIKVTGFEDSSLSPDHLTGHFISFPIPVGEGLVVLTASAPGYKPLSKAIPRSKAQEEEVLRFELVKDGHLAYGTVKGIVKNARTGRPIKHATIFVPSLNQRVMTDPTGQFSFSVLVGRYDVLISTPRLQTQRKRVEIQESDVIILNVDMNF